MIEAFPLCWPAGFPRHTGKKVDSQFKTTLEKVRNGILNNVKLLGGSEVIFSTNIPVRNDGQYYATMRVVGDDHGAAVYFILKGEQRVLACDQYARLWENLRAIELSIEAMRGLGRWGCSDILNRTFTGFKALPESISQRPWWDVLLVKRESPADIIKTNYRSLVKEHHPDTGGNPEKFHEIQKAYKEALEEKGV